MTLLQRYDEFDHHHHHHHLNNHQKLFREDYDHSLLHSNRKSAIERAKTARSVGIILGTLGRQGSVGIFEKLSVEF